jgi:hypothetical protein
MDNIKDIWRFEIRVGNSKHPRDGACVLDAVSWLMYGVLGDHPECVCPVIAKYVRSMNDCLPNRARQKLRSYIPHLAGSGDDDAQTARSEFLEQQVYHVYLPKLLRMIDEPMFAALYLSLRNWPERALINAYVYASLVRRFKKERSRTVGKLLSYAPLRASSPLGSLAALYITEAASYRMPIMDDELFATLDGLLKVVPSDPVAIDAAAAMDRFELLRTQ